MSIYDRMNNNLSLMLSRTPEREIIDPRLMRDMSTPPPRRQPPVLQSAGIPNISIPNFNIPAFNFVAPQNQITSIPQNQMVGTPEVLENSGVSEEVIDDVVDEPELEPEPETQAPVMPPAPPPTPPTAPPAPPPEPTPPPSSLTGLGGFYSPEQVQMIMNPPRTQVNTSDMEKLLQLQGNTFRNFLVQPAPVETVQAPAPVSPPTDTLGPGGITVEPIRGNPYINYNNTYNPVLGNINNPFNNPINFTGITSLVPNDAINDMLLKNQMFGLPQPISNVFLS